MATPQVTSRILRRLLASGVTGRAERLLGRMAPSDVALLLPELTPDEIRAVIELLFRQRRAALALRELPHEMLPSVYDALADQRLAAVIGRLEIDDLLEFVEMIPEDRREGVVERLPEDRREELRKAELYSEYSAGRVMTTSFIALDQKMRAQEAIDSLREAGDGSEAVLYLYVVDEQRTLVGVVPIRRLVASPPDRLISEIMIPDPVSVSADDDQEEVARLVARFDLLAVPVTDVDGRMLGLITVDDVIDVITEEATEDMYHLAGLTEADRVFVPAHESIRKRLPWMFLNLATCFAAAWVVGLFERTIEQVVALAIFMPVVAGMGGNGGTQSLTVITRAIALGEIEFSSALRAVVKELAVGLALGIAMGLAGAGIAYLWHADPIIGVALCSAMVLTLSVAGLVGAAVPLALKALKQDPALGSGVIVTTFTDAFAFFSFLGIATLLMNRLVS
ncbi:MAG: magnesium transporter [Deltaproteobacteria bacterium]|jgi:magnesium transporter|nr:magnesium transporter [Deltaproteobacteria bacterium]MBW2541342.1 magnesium transporter [Deltaproteobacteria bacterium]